MVLLHRPVSDAASAPHDETSNFLTTKEAAALVRCTPSYAGMLCRAGRLRGSQILGSGRCAQWLVDPLSIAKFQATANVAARARVPTKLDTLLSVATSDASAARDLAALGTVRIIPTGDGSFRVSPRPARAEYTVRQAAEVAGVKIGAIYLLYAAGILEGPRFTVRKIVITSASLLCYMKNVSDPGFWTADRLERYREAMKPKRPREQQTAL